MAGLRRSSSRSRAAVVPFPGHGRGAGGRALALLPSGRSVATGFALLALAAGAYAAARTTTAFSVRSVEIRGATPAIARDVRSVLGDVRGESLLALDGERLLARVEAIPAVATARYDRAFPHTLVVVVTREQPLAVLRRGSESWLLSARARVLGKVSRGAHARLPRVWVRRSTPVAAGAIVEDAAARDAVAALRPLRGEPLPVRVGTVETARDALTFKLRSGLELRLGGRAQLPLKLAVAREILRELPPPAQGGPRYLDLSVPERPVAGTLNAKVEVEG